MGWQRKPQNEVLAVASDFKDNDQVNYCDWDIHAKTVGKTVGKLNSCEEIRR
jgi:hypothetical protein